MFPSKVHDLDNNQLYKTNDVNPIACMTDLTYKMFGSNTEKPSVDQINRIWGHHIIK